MRRGRGKHAAIYSISAASLTVAISYVWQRFLVFLYRFYILPICNSYLISILQHFPVIQHNISIVINIFRVLLFFWVSMSMTRSKLRNDLPRPLAVRLDF